MLIKRRCSVLNEMSILKAFSSVYAVFRVLYKPPVYSRNERSDFSGGMLRVLKRLRNPIKFLFSSNLGSWLLLQALNTLPACAVIEQKRPGGLFI